MDGWMDAHFGLWSNNPLHFEERHNHQNVKYKCKATHLFQRQISWLSMHTTWQRVGITWRQHWCMFWLIPVCGFNNAEQWEDRTDHTLWDDNSFSKCNNRGKPRRRWYSGCCGLRDKERWITVRCCIWINWHNNAKSALPMDRFFRQCQHSAMCMQEQQRVVCYCALVHSCGLSMESSNMCSATHVWFDRDNARVSQRRRFSHSPKCSTVSDSKMPKRIRVNNGVGK